MLKGWWAASLSKVKAMRAKEQEAKIRYQKEGIGAAGLREHLSHPSPGHRRSQSGQADEAVGGTVQLGSAHDISVGELAKRATRVMDRPARALSTDERTRPQHSEVAQLLSDPLWRRICWVGSRRSVWRMGPPARPSGFGRVRTETRSSSTCSEAVLKQRSDLKTIPAPSGHAVRPRNGRLHMRLDSCSS